MGDHLRLHDSTLYPPGRFRVPEPIVSEGLVAGPRDLLDDGYVFTTHTRIDTAVAIPAGSNTTQVAPP